MRGSPVILHMPGVNPGPFTCIGFCYVVAWGMAPFEQINDQRLGLFCLHRRAAKRKTHSFPSKKSSLAELEPWSMGSNFADLFHCLLGCPVRSWVAWGERAFHNMTRGRSRGTWQPLGLRNTMVDERIPAALVGTPK